MNAVIARTAPAMFVGLRQTLTASKFYSMEHDSAFRSRVFMELQND